MLQRISWRLAWLILVAVFISIDQLSKAYFSSALPLGGSIPVTGWFNWVYVLNNGAAFSFLANHSGWQRYFLIGVALVVVTVVAYMVMTGRTTRGERWLGAALVAGGLGNVIDRVWIGAVVDFLDFYWGNWHWPAFNFADVFVVGAALLWIVLNWRQAPAAQEKKTA